MSVWDIASTEDVRQALGPNPLPRVRGDWLRMFTKFDSLIVTNVVALVLIAVPKPSPDTFVMRSTKMDVVELGSLLTAHPDLINAQDSRVRVHFHT